MAFSSSSSSVHQFSWYFTSFVITCVWFLCLVNNQVSCRKGKLIKLNEDNWDDLLTGEWMVEFYAPWCPACQSLEPHWDSFSSWSDELNIKVGNIDVTANPGLSGRFMVTALPTIYHVKDGQFRQYKGSRETNAFVGFVEEKKWQTLETISNWKHPSSIQMSIVSQFFKISMALRAVHNRLVQDYGIPYWGSYVLFALATILLGTILGLIIVCIIDIFLPFKQPPIGADCPRTREKEDLIEDVQGDNLSEDAKELRKRKTTQSTESTASSESTSSTKETESKKSD
ncbi:thioredoxin-related transmembrane protein 1-like [Panonychus citri]|uniref:thioredoxin-related transmembrane protein 1-like n=1 Tax=Panonychus citri TaxID=50023 RepID=UPI0023079DEA|nr:thioredoxin-related transmembrane protein 1-like [Panonychus citri]